MSLISTDITRELATLLGYCTAAGGFTSNVGALVRSGVLAGGYQQAPAAFLVPGRQSGERMYGEVVEVTRAYEVRGFADLNDHPTLEAIDVVDLVIWDIRRCLEVYDPAVLSLVQQIRYLNDKPGYPEDGGTIVGAALNYEVIYTVNLNDPETAA